MISKKTVWSTRNNPFPVKVKNQRSFSFRKSSLVFFLLLFTGLQSGLPQALLLPELLLSHTERLHNPSVR